MLSSEPYALISCVTGIEVAVIVVVIGYQLLYMSGMGGKQGSHGIKIKWRHLDLDDFH